MMFLENITEKEVYKKKKIKTSFGETLSWKYLTFVRKNPIEVDEVDVLDEILTM